MKKSVFFAILLIFSQFSFSFGQRQPRRATLVNKNAFEIKSGGIEKLANAYVFVYNDESRFPQASAIERLWNELKSSDLDPELRGGKEDQLKKLQNELRRVSQERYQNLEKIFVEPIKQEISEALKRFEFENDLLIFDGVELEEKGLLLAFDRRFDVTKQFIAYFNDNARNTGGTDRLKIPPSKIGIVNTNKLFGKEKGLNKIKDGYDDLQQFCANDRKCDEIYQSLQSFAEANGYTLILDASRRLPEEFSDFRIEEITQEFIINYNRNNP